jgi:hypothetical protein
MNLSTQQSRPLRLLSRSDDTLHCAGAKLATDLDWAHTLRANMNDRPRNGFSLLLRIRPRFAPQNQHFWIRHCGLLRRKGCLTVIESA